MSRIWNTSGSPEIGTMCWWHVDLYIQSVPGGESVIRTCLNPPPKSTGTNRMQYYLPDELVLIGCRHRTDSMQPEKNSFLGRGTCVGPLFLQKDLTGANKVLFDGDWHLCRWRWTRFAHQHAVAVPWHAQKVVVRSDLAGEAQDCGCGLQHNFYLGTERTAMNSLVPFLPVLQDRTGLRHALRLRMGRRSGNLLPVAQRTNAST